MQEAKAKQPDSYKPKTTIIPANPGITAGGGCVVVAWIIEDGQIARAITYREGAPIEFSTQRGADE